MLCAYAQFRFPVFFPMYGTCPRHCATPLSRCARYFFSGSDLSLCHFMSKMAAMYIVHDAKCWELAYLINQHRTMQPIHKGPATHHFLRQQGVSFLVSLFSLFSTMTHNEWREVLVMRAINTIAFHKSTMCCSHKDKTEIKNNKEANHIGLQNSTRIKGKGIRVATFCCRSPFLTITETLTIRRSWNWVC